MKQGDLIELIATGERGIVAEVSPGLVAVMRMDWPFPRPPKVYPVEQVRKVQNRYEGREDKVRIYGEATL